LHNVCACRRQRVDNAIQVRNDESQPQRHVDRVLVIAERVQFENDVSEPAYIMLRA
jgi:hypothetical protein